MTDDKLVRMNGIVFFCENEDDAPEDALHVETIRLEDAESEFTRSSNIELSRAIVEQCIRHATARGFDVNCAPVMIVRKILL